MHAPSHAVAQSPGTPPRAKTLPLLARWRARRRAQRYYDWARAIDVASGDHARAHRAARLYQRGLRCLRPAFPGGIPGKGLGSRDRLEWGLAMSVPWRRPSSWSSRRRAAAAGTAVGVLGLAIGLAALVSSVAAPRNLAQGKRWRASSADAGFPSEGRLEGAAAPTAFMHTTEEERPSLIIDLDGVRAIGGFEIENRRDCCADRTVPLAIEISSDGKAWSLLARRTAGFATWIRRFDTVTARFVRLQIERRSMLHLSRVGIYGR